MNAAPNASTTAAVPPPEFTEWLRRLEEKVAYLERHVFEQDKEMLGLVRQMERLHAELGGLRERLSAPQEKGGGPVARTADWAAAAAAADNERPPHY